MNNTNDFLRDYMSVAQRARDLELNPLPCDVTSRSIRNLLLIVLVYVVLALGIIKYFPPGDFTDSGVKCTDDCLDSMEDRKP